MLLETMMAPKPGLPPSMAKDLTFPSELREPHSTRYLDASIADKKQEPTEDQTETITPPPAYTEFLGTFSPIFTSSTDSRASFAKYMLDKPRRSPTSAPSSAISSSFFCSTTTTTSRKCTPVTLPPLTPATTCSATARSPDHLRRLRIPSPYHVLSASAIATPRSAQSLSSRSLYSPYSPSEWTVRRVESPVSQNGDVSVRHVVTTTITFKRAPRLEPPPPGKRRRNATHAPRET